MQNDTKRETRVFSKIMLLGLMVCCFLTAAPAKWTFMVYLDADNNLEIQGIVDFMEMAAVGSSDDVNIVTQIDRHPFTMEPLGYTGRYGNWSGTKRFLIKKDDDPSVNPVQDIGEKNMGDPEVLQDFIVWAVTNYPAEHYALVIWNHGQGWRDEGDTTLTAISEKLSSAVAKFVASDDTDCDVLFMKEVQVGIEAAQEDLQGQLNMAVKFDIMGYDACLMGMIEVAFAMRNVADYMIASEHSEPGMGWPYNRILEALVANPSMAPEELAEIIVTEYVGFYTATPCITMSAVDITELNSLCTKIDDFTNEATTEWSALKTSRDNAVTYNVEGDSIFWGVDLMDFANKVHQNVTSELIKTKAYELKKAVEDIVIIEGHSGDMEGSHGIAIYFPPNGAEFNRDPLHSGYEQNNTYMVVDFVKHHDWDNWLQDFYSNIP
jgi:hypothetical protein